MESRIQSTTDWSGLGKKIPRTYLERFAHTVAGFFYDNLQKFEGKMEGQVMWQLVKTMKDTNAQLMQLCFFHENYLKIKEEANINFEDHKIIKT